MRVSPHTSHVQMCPGPALSLPVRAGRALVVMCPPHGRWGIGVVCGASAKGRSQLLFPKLLGACLQASAPWSSLCSAQATQPSLILLGLVSDSPGGIVLYQRPGIYKSGGGHGLKIPLAEVRGTDSRKAKAGVLARRFL